MKLLDASAMPNSTMTRQQKREGGLIFNAHTVAAATTTAHLNHPLGALVWFKKTKWYH
jgi:2-keto-4-pentenoate hydratase